jgi:2,5-furandicarboxylate decarboxylase 1
MPFRDLRAFIAYLEDQKELRRIRKLVDTTYEIAAYIRKTSDIKGPALLFENVKHSHIPVLGGVFATRKRALLALQTSDKECADKFQYALEHLLPPRTVASAPCKEVILKSADADLSRFPIPIFSQGDSGPFITAGLVISKDPESARSNTSIYRLQVHDSHRLGVKAQQLQRQLRKAEARGEALPVAIAIGTDPVLMLASQWDAPYGVDEIELAGALRGEPVEVVRAETVDLMVPATAEIIIEGYIQPKTREIEGPFGEVGVYYYDIFPNRVI